jgi:hypothetical protein
MRAAWVALTLASGLASGLACGEARGDADAIGSGAAPARSTDSSFADSVLRAAEDMGSEMEVRASSLAAPLRDVIEIRLTLQAYSSGTYLAEILAARDSTNYRWPERTREPLLVWVQRATLDDREAGFPRAVEESFLPWTEVGIPIAFLFTEDSARAEIHVTWVDRYESRTTGRTRWVRDQHGWIIAASIELARAQPDGSPLDARQVSAIARHEVGHLLGLDHTADETSIMSERVRVTELSEADRATVRLVYLLPPGSVRAPR